MNHSEMFGNTVNMKVESVKKDSKTGARKAAECLLLLGRKDADNVLRHMSLDEVREVLYELVHMKDQDDAEQGQGLSGNEFKKEKKCFSGGVDTARGFLKVAFGSHEGERILRNAASDFFEPPFSFLEELDEFQLSTLLKDESFETLSLILPRLSPQKVKPLLQGMPLEMQAAIIQRIATMKKVDSSVILKIEEVLHKRIKKYQDFLRTTEINGGKTLANILRYMSLGNEKKILSYLAETKPDIAKSVETHILSIENLLHMSTRDLYDIFQGMEEDEIALLIRGQTYQIREKILHAIPSGKREQILKKESMTSSVKRKEVDKVTQVFLKSLRLKELEGNLTVLRPGETFV